MKLSILDYAIVDEGNCIRSYRRKYAAGSFSRKSWVIVVFWMAEHHQVPALASSSPELLMLHLLQNTEKNTNRYRWNNDSSLFTI